ncbi:response regulator transcription factor [Nocardioides sp.]|uniref:response regulator transcription factor n=1 Tax=Nocardioides sp. TaxID=35761 RepID=UPI00286D9229|nr:response regulator transcription factor [Nocardioides sp.]
MPELTSTLVPVVPMPRTGVHTDQGRSTRSVVVIDDHSTFAELLKFAIDSDSELRCLGVAADLVSGLRLVATQQPDLVVMDYEFSNDEGDGLTATAAITSRFPGIHVVLLTGHADSTLVRRAVEARASSVLPKNGSLRDLMDALKSAGKGGLLVHPGLLGPAKGPAGGGDRRDRTENPLSRRERDVLAMLMLGMRSDAIAQELGITTSTCRGYIKALLWKLGAHSQLEAVAIARRRGLALDT